jgi:hypothetical protein
MAKGYILSKQSAKDFQEMRARFRGTHGRPRQEQRRRVRTGGSGGSDIVYIEITASTDINTYTGTIYDNPTDRNIVEVDVTVKAMQHDAGTIPNSASGEGFFCYKNGDNYYILNYSVFYG